jgi:chitin synthase
MAHIPQGSEQTLLQKTPSPQEQHEIYPPQFNYRNGAQPGSQSTRKPFFLCKGNFVADCALPPLLRSTVEDDDDEFTHTLYTAITCGPDDFHEEGFALRQTLFAPPRRTKIMINIYMYNEGDISFAETIMSVFDNIQDLCDKWGDESWKNIIVCILSAGRYNIDPQTKAILSVMGIYQEGIARRQVNGREVTAHLYEHTTRVGLQIEGGKVRVVPKEYRYPIQMLFCLEEKNKTKVHSDKWVYRGFARVLDPVICVPIQDETKLGHLAIYQLWKTFAAEPMCAAACGRVKPDMDGLEIFNIAQSACNFEQHLQNSLTLPFGAFFGFASVSPARFCAFRYEALKDDETGKSPLESYFEANEPPDPSTDSTISAARTKLVSLRLVFFALVTRPNSRWVIRYAESAIANVYMGGFLGELISMRRGVVIPYFLDTCYAVTHYREIFKSSHSIVRKAAFIIQIAFNFVELLFLWFALGNMFIYFKVLTTSMGSRSLLGIGGYVAGLVLEWFYDVSLVATFSLSLSRTWRLKRVMILRILFTIWFIITS